MKHIASTADLPVTCMELAVCFTRAFNEAQYSGPQIALRSSSLLCFIEVFHYHSVLTVKIDW